LSGDLAPYWSRRIDECKRLVYRIDGEFVKLSNVVLIIRIRDEWTPGMMNVDIFKETLALASLLGNPDQVITLDANFLILPNRR
jgi:hypothetical protein